MPETAPEFDRHPHPVPFKKGTTLRYVGKPKPYRKRNAVGLVTWVSKGFRGDLGFITTREGEPLFWDDDPQRPVRVRSVDGTSGVMCGGKCFRVQHHDAHEWEIIA